MLAVAEAMWPEPAVSLGRKKKKSWEESVLCNLLGVVRDFRMEWIKESFGCSGLQPWGKAITGTRKGCGRCLPVEE